MDVHLRGSLNGPTFMWEFEWTYLYADNVWLHGF